MFNDMMRPWGTNIVGGEVAVLAVLYIVNVLWRCGNVGIATDLCLFIFLFFYFLFEVQ